MGGGKFQRRKSRPSKARVSKANYKAIKQVIAQSAEKKYFIDSAGPTSVSNTGQSFTLCDVPQGDGQSERLGNRVNLKQLLVNWNMAGGDNYQMFRLMVIQQTDTTAPGLTNIFSNANTALAPLSQYVNDQISNIRVLYDSGAISQYGSGSSFNKSGKIRINFATKKNAMKSVNYEADANVDGPGAVRLYVISDSGTATHPNFGYVSKLLYTDQ